MALWGFRAKCWSGWVSGFEEKEGVMRNAMTTRAPCGANNTKGISDLKSLRGEKTKMKMLCTDTPP